MKKCPYCAEEIQQSALKCRYCGEWLDKGSENVRSAINEANLSTADLTQSNTVKSNATLSGSLDIKSITEFKLEEDSSEASPEIVLPMPSRPKWGWGWFILFCLNPGFFKPGYYESTTFNLLALANPIISLVFYFWYRKRLLNKNPYALNIKNLSFRAGFVSYLLAIGIFIVGVVFGEIQEHKEFQSFSSAFQREMSQFKDHESKIQSQLILSPTNENEMKTNVSLLKDYLRLMDRRKGATDQLVSYIQNYGSRKKNQQILAAVKTFDQDNTRASQVANEAIKALVEHHTTGDPNRYKSTKH